jgi:pyruvate/2-oxoglutarate dehydrogenase complex dihydrolipoamide dehydrogenase (E3) component
MFTVILPYPCHSTIPLSFYHTLVILPYPCQLQPEVAHVGLYQDDLTAKGIKFDTYTRHLKDVDRAMLDGETEGAQS